MYHQMYNTILSRRLGLLLMILFLHVTGGRVFGETKIVDDEVIQKWKSYELFARSLQGKSRKTITSDSGKTEHLLMAFKQNARCVMSCFSKEQEITEICRFGNPHYAASIKRNKSDASAVVLEKLTENPHGSFPGIRGDHTSVFELTLPSISPHFRVISVPLTRFIGDPSFTILGESKEWENGKGLIRFDYSFSGADSANGLQSKGRGLILLDSSQCWCVRKSKYALSMTQKGTPVMDTEHEIEFETLVHSSGYPLVKASKSHDSVYLYKTKRKTASTQKIEYEWDVNDNVPDSEFTLSAFGLPEPMGVEPLHPPRTWLWLLVGALCTATLAFLFVWLKHRHAGEAPPPSSVS